MLSENQLLNHIYQTAEMGQDGIRTVLKYADEPGLVRVLNSQLEEYQRIQNTAGAMLHARGEPPKGIGPMAKLSSEAMTAVKSLTDPSATNIAEMMIQGSSMGITEAVKKLHQYENDVEKDIKKLMERLQEFEEENVEKLKEFL